MIIKTTVPIVLLIAPAALGQVTKIELTPTQVGSGNSSFFTVAPTTNPSLYFGRELVKRAGRGQVVGVNFNTAPDGPLSEGLQVSAQYASWGVTMNSIRITADIYGGNLYGPGFATEDNDGQIFTFTEPVIAVGIVNTSPDKDKVEFFSGPDGTGVLLFSFNDQEGQGMNFNIDRFVGGVAEGCTTIGSFKISNISGDDELDELIFIIADPPGCVADLNGDESVDGADLGLLLGAWDSVGDGTGLGDLDCSGLVDGGDLGQLLSMWGEC
jgi:hypothetical protein